MPHKADTTPRSVPAIFAPASPMRSPWRMLVASRAGVIGLVVLAMLVGSSVLTIPWTFAGAPESPRYDQQQRYGRHLPPFWASWAWTPERQERLEATAKDLAQGSGSEKPAHPKFWLGTDLLGRSLLVRCLAGGGVSLGIGLAAAFLSVLLGTIYGGLSGYLGGRVDEIMMRVVDVLYGLPYVLLVVLLAVASDAVVERWQFKAATGGSGDEVLSAGTVQTIKVVTLMVAIGGVSWLTMSRVIRGQVLSLKAQPFMEAARAMGVGVWGQMIRHLLPNLVGPIVVYATLTVPQAILQESFLSFLGIGVQPPMPTWGNLAAEGLSELNPYQSHWWLLLFPCVLLGGTLLALNFVGEGLREALDPKRGVR